jgi:hypothetical protein
MAAHPSSYSPVAVKFDEVHLCSCCDAPSAWFSVPAHIENDQSIPLDSRDKTAGQPIHQFIKQHFSDIPIENIDSFFGFTTYTPLYGGRIWDDKSLNGAELSAYDIRSMYKMGINLRLPLTNHHASLEEYKENIPFLEKYYRPGNAIITTNDDLARWIRADFPDYHIEASVIKNINSLKKIDKAEKTYDTVVLPMSCNEDEPFLKSIEDKSIIRLFSNAGCALTCPSKMCYPSVSLANKTRDPSLFKCSRRLKERELLGMIDFDLDYLQSLGFHRFKMLRSRPGGNTGH